MLYPLPGKNYAASLYNNLKKGNELYRNEKFDEALNTYLDAQVEHPEDPNLKYNIASSYYKMNNYEEAVKGYLDVIATAQDITLEEKALYNVGNAMYRQGKLEEAVTYYEKALELDPDDQDAKHNLEFVREEIKKRLNQAKKTAQQQQQQQQKEQQQQQKEQQQAQEEQSQENQQQDQSQETGQDEQPLAQQQQAQRDQQENEENNEMEQSQAQQQQAREMTKEEAEQWLNTIQEDREKFAKMKPQGQTRGKYRPEKDW